MNDHFVTSVSKIFDDANLRLDASFYAAVAGQANHGWPTARLGELAEVSLPNRFERVWADGPNYGLPYLNATDLLPLFALGNTTIRYLSRQSKTDIEALIVRKDWLLMTASGTIGRVYHIPDRLDGWAATHDLIRIIPNSTDMVGFLYAWLTLPTAQEQILRHTHGGQITHVTDQQAKELEVPMPSKRVIKDINDRVVAALKAREEALQALTTAWPQK